jgi:hypothetical protein
MVAASAAAMLDFNEIMTVLCDADDVEYSDRLLDDDVDEFAGHDDDFSNAG